MIKVREIIILLLFPFSTIVSAGGESQYLETRKIVVLDDGSSGSRLVAFFFGRNNTDEEFRLIRSSKIIQASALKEEDGGLTDDSAEKIVTMLNENSNQPNSQSMLFLGMTAGKREDRLGAGRLLKMIRSKLIKFGVDEHKHSLELRVLDGSMEGAYNWLGVNYVYADSKNSYGIVELGGASAQIAYKWLADTKVQVNDDQSEEGDKNFLLFESGYDRNKTHTLFARSQMGFGLNKAYKGYEHLHPEVMTRHCEAADSSSYVDFKACKESMEELFVVKETEPKNQFIWQQAEQDARSAMPDTYYLSGYFYDYTVDMGLRSHLTVEQLEKAAKYACDNFTVKALDEALASKNSENEINLFKDFEATLPPMTKERVVTLPSDFVYSGSFKPAKSNQYCGTLTYMASLLEHFGLQPHHNLVIVKSFKFEGKTYPATWTAGYAYARANGYKITLLDDQLSEKEALEELMHTSLMPPARNVAETK
ncbi:hypothetical protein GZ77_18960 [Endozoicomonas montiporae]|uniref:Nucleoside phosphatase n=1 Tax=Endozoicomonas montiporae TaxID=1027273 RepID=A0A081N2B4_9GAMM|nr:hypothetical protein [Endozoicomonas montiporae]KEQ12587.1 hypothetical protein GZ77_18960 [Endozoicomonas montiporae]